ncbi:MAG: glycosyltransferase family 39 protein [Polyangiaceae bacterium]
MITATGAAARRLRDRCLVAAVALVARGAVIAWGGSRFPPAADGTYYHRIAERIASGHGYTWVWPDGAVTFAAHYPIGYPALIGVFYTLFGVHPIWAMIVNALFGVAGSVAAYELSRSSGFGKRAALFSGIGVALHPALLPYTLAVMTEGVTGALLVIAAAFAARSKIQPKKRWIIAIGMSLGIATLVRPQSILLAPLFGWLASRGSMFIRVRTAIVVSALAIACCLPWTARNCVRMHRCALVSMNAGWNLLIGEESTSGAWQPIDVPEDCKTVWDEAAKDACFDRDARARIENRPWKFLSHMPQKLSVTFDYFGGAPWYLHESNPAAFGDTAKTRLAIFETIVSRIFLAGALLSFAFISRRNRFSWLVALVGLPFAFMRAGWLATAALAVAILVSKRGRENVALGSASWTLLATAATHAIFFGAGRYGLVSSPFIFIVCASCGMRAWRGKFSPSLATRSFKNSLSKS